MENTLGDRGKMTREDDTIIVLNLNQLMAVFKKGEGFSRSNLEQYVGESGPYN